MRLPAIALLILAALTTPAIAADAVIEEAGIAFELPAAWRAKIEHARLPTGQLMQRWVRDELETLGGSASPGMIAVATPVPDDANLALLTQNVMARKPFNVKLGSETRCIKCKKYRIELSGGSAIAEAPDWHPACQKPGGQSEIRDCQSVDSLKLQIEPSWAHTYEKATPSGRMRVLHIHLLNDGRFVDISFWYPFELADKVEAEIFPIVASMRRSPAIRGMDTAPGGQAFRHRRDLLPQLLDELPRHVPEGLALTAVRQEGGQIALVGRAVSNTAVAALMRNLDGSPYFGQPELREVKAVAAAGRRLNEFAIRISPRVRPEPPASAGDGPCSTLPPMLARRSDVENLLIEINMSGLEKGIQFELFRPVQERGYGSYAVLPVEVQLQGSYLDLRLFVHKLGTLPGLLIVDGFSLAGGKDETLSLRAVVNVHRQLGGPTPDRATPQTECPAGIGHDAIDPFSPSRLARPDAPRNRPDPDRPRSPLEAYPLESLRFIGMLEVNRRPIAVVQSEDGVRQVKTGDYLGQHSGLVTSITESGIVLRELVPDGNGGYAERTSTLPRQERQR